MTEESKGHPWLIDVWAPWCGRCKQLTPILEKVVKAAKGAVKLVKMNIDDHPAIPGQMGIQSIPAVIAFVNGQPTDGFMGAQSEAQINAFLERLTKGAVAAGTKDFPAERGPALPPRPTETPPPTHSESPPGPHPHHRPAHRGRPCRHPPAAPAGRRRRQQRLRPCRLGRRQAVVHLAAAWRASGA